MRNDDYSFVPISMISFTAVYCGVLSTYTCTIANAPFLPTLLAYSLEIFGLFYGWMMFYYKGKRDGVIEFEKMKDG